MLRSQQCRWDMSINVQSDMLLVIEQFAMGNPCLIGTQSVNVPFSITLNPSMVHFLLFQFAPLCSPDIFLRDIVISLGKISEFDPRRGLHFSPHLCKSFPLSFLVGVYRINYMYRDIFLQLQKTVGFTYIIYVRRHIYSTCI